MLRTGNWKWKLKSNPECGHDYDNYLNRLTYSINVSDSETLVKDTLMT